MASNNLPAPIEELNVEAEVTERGLKGVVRSRAIVAIDRLVGNLIDVPSVYLEALKRRIEIRAAVKDALIESEGRAALEKLERKPEIGDRVVDSFLRKEARRQENQEAVARKTLDELAALPPPYDVCEDDDKPLDDDWLNLFSAYAENASSERLRIMWGRVLAGEIRKPGSFSLATLRFISELDKDIASAFQEVARTRFNEMFIPTPAGLKDESLFQLSFLEEVGLLQGTHGYLATSFNKAADGYVYITTVEPKFQSKSLKIKVAHEQIDIHVVKLTRIGREIASILPEEDQSTALEAIAEQRLPGVISIELCQLTGRQGDTASWITVRTIKSSDN
ncbi:MAG: DUF2806 domain-containing protein [Pseudorhodoplanes sp.]|uniref:DUF2806 domain-containing protein n=1 Tax=Methylocystis sp. TaxID=1911079 RepID=UPI003D0D56B2